MRELGVEELHTSNPGAGEADLGKLCIRGQPGLGLDDKIVSQNKVNKTADRARWEWEKREGKGEKRGEKGKRNWKEQNLMA